MKLSGHSYDSEIFGSLLDQLNGDVIIKTQPKKPEPILTGMDVFSSSTEQNYNAVVDDEMKDIVAELQFAADRSRISLTKEDLYSFAKTAKNDGLRGKGLERAAQRYCNNMDRAVAAPQGTTKTSFNNDIISSLNDKTIIPSGHVAGENKDKRAGFMGQSRNPNSIWDSDALSRLASKPDAHMDKFGDEQIAESFENRRAYKEQLNAMRLEDIKPQNAESTMRNTVTSVSTGKEIGTTQRLPENSMSMFSNNRDFENIPEKTAGEQIRENKQKVAEVHDEQIKTAEKINNSGDSLFEDKNKKSKYQSSHRKAIDKLFDGLANITK